jgi:hypothetical protein
MMRKLTQQEHDDLALHCQISAETIAYAIDRAVARATAWQPIETAPRDKHVTVLVYGARYDQVLEAAYNDESGYWTDYFTMTSYDEENITHWMPLPKPPVTE